MWLPTFNSIIKHWTENNTSLSIVWREENNPLAYEEARVSRVFNCQRPHRYPRAIVSAKTESDIARTVKLAIDQKCSVSVRAGGHSWPIWSLRDDTILLDLGKYSEIALDEKTGIIRASPSTTGKELTDYLHSRHLAFPAGHCPDVGIGGYLLCGGMGWNTNVSISYERVKLLIPSLPSTTISPFNAVLVHLFFCAPADPSADAKLT